MKVMVLESDAGAADQTIGELEAAGHAVVRCHERGLDAFPCNALLDDGSCPLDHKDVDVAVVVRAHPWPRQRPLERGVECAVRHRIPLVVSGTTMLHPFDGYVATEEHHGLEAALTEAATGALPDESRSATMVARAMLRRAGLNGDHVDAVVHRRGGRLRVTVTGAPDLDHGARSAVAVGVLAELRKHDRHVPGIDISVE